MEEFFIKKKNNEVWDEFLREWVIEKKSQKTLHKIKLRLKELETVSKKNFSEIYQKEIDDFLFIKSKVMKEHSMKPMYAYLSSFFFKMFERKFKSRPYKANKKGKIRYLEKNQFNELLNRIGCEDLELFCIVSLSYYFGLRIDSVLSIKKNDLKGKYIHIGETKGNIPIDEKVPDTILKQLNEYIESTKNKGSIYLFNMEYLKGPRKGKFDKIYPKKIEEKINDYLVDVNRSDLHGFHTIRHTRGMITTEEAGGDLRPAKNILRHSSIQTTEIYGGQLAMKLALKKGLKGVDFFEKTNETNG